MSSLFSNNYLSNRPVEKAMLNFATGFSPSQRVLDIGCGYMPYKKYFNCHYVGADPLSSVRPDIVCSAWKIPVDNNSFDGVILNQSLEHILYVRKTIAEIERVLKPGGLVIVTTPQTMKNHSQAIAADESPYNNFAQTGMQNWQNDFYRFTKYGLISLFEDFSIISISESTGYFGSMYQLINYFFASFRQDVLFSPIYFLNNVFGLSFDFLGRQTRRINHPIAHKFYYDIFTSLTINLILVIRKKH